MLTAGQLLQLCQSYRDQLKQGASTEELAIMQEHLQEQVLTYVNANPKAAEEHEEIKVILKEITQLIQARANKILKQNNKEQELMKQHNVYLAAMKHTQ